MQRAPARRRSFAWGLGALGLVALATVVSGLPGEPAAAREGASVEGNGTCVICHDGIEEMHPFAPVTCVQCHGGDPTANELEDAHVPQRTSFPGDERVLGRNFDPDYLRFLDPGNLRIAAQSCGPCHPEAVYDVEHSLHASTAGHLGDGLYENGVVRERHPEVSVFSVSDDRSTEEERPPGAVGRLRQIRGFRFSGDDDVARHFTDLPRKACMQCHLWSRGRAVRGRAGLDGDYRGEGCSACHVPYADDGLSLSRDPTVDKYEPGHPREHRMVRFPTTDTCVRCHYGDASIGLSFRGLAQPVPGMPQSPDAPGLHRKRLNGVYYIDDAAATPADVHHQAGMHCVDCHTRGDVMGDGFLYKRMEDAVEIRCETCHGTPDAYATGETKRGNRLPHLERTEEGVFLRSRVTGERHRVKQARDVVRPGSSDYNREAAMAMTADHGRLECYACHSGWNPNFFGFHFDRNEAFTQLDLLSGQRTEGRVTTQEKVFSTFKSFYLGWNSHGRIAPYMVGFSSMASVHDEEGRLVLDQALPVTTAGLSGMTMIHHQTHTTTARARKCVECHRAPSTFGRGSVNFRLARDFLVTGGDRGLRALSFDRKSPGDTAPLATLPIAGIRALALDRDRLTGHARRVYTATSDGKLVVANFELAGFPTVDEEHAETLTDPRHMVVRGRRLFVADGAGGLRVFDLERPDEPKLVAHLADLPAYDLFLDGTTLFVAAGRRGVVVLELPRDEEPAVVLDGFDVNGADTAPNTVATLDVLFQYSRPNPEQLEEQRTPARRLLAVGTTDDGAWIIDATEPRKPRTLAKLPLPGGPRVGVADVALATVYELGSDGGAIPTRERDHVVAVTPGRISMVDVTDPRRPTLRSGQTTVGAPRDLELLRVYNPPFLQTFAVVAGAEQLVIHDLGAPDQVSRVAALTNAPGTYDVEMEFFPLDRTVDADGRPIMDVSHEDARWLDEQEFRRVMGVPRFWNEETR